MLTKCKECGQDISSDAKVCPHCGKKNSKSSGCVVALLSVIIIILLLLILAFCSQVGKHSSSSNPQNTPSQDAIIEKLISQGYATIKPEYCQVYLESFIWEGSNAEVKQNMTASFAKYVAKLNNDGSDYFIEIYDKQSGKKLAKWGSSSGYRQYYP